MLNETKSVRYEEPNPTIVDRIKGLIDLSIEIARNSTCIKEKIVGQSPECGENAEKLIDCLESDLVILHRRLDYAYKTLVDVNGRI